VKTESGIRRMVHCIIPFASIISIVLRELAAHLQRTAGGILLPKGPPKANSDAHYGEVRAVRWIDLQVSNTIDVMSISSRFRRR